MTVNSTLPPEGCMCGEVLKGLIDPPSCGLFRLRATRSPRRPRRQYLPKAAAGLLPFQRRRRTDWGALTIGHGAGGSLTRTISLITGHFDANPRADGEDCAILPDGFAVTIDGYTVSPLSFNGGDCRNSRSAGAPMTCQ